MKEREMVKKANELLAKLDFDDCIILFNTLERGNPMIDLIFDRMEALDEERFDKFLDS